MNDKARELKLDNTQFKDASGLNEENQSTAEEMANLIRYTLNLPVLSEILETQKKTISSLNNKFIHNLISTNKLLGKIPIILGGKTGFTTEAGGCMLTFSNIDNNYLITVVLGSENREDDTEKLINWAQTAWIWE
jgi:D-alanyl-D-alanine carboxypeptidase